MGGYPLFLALVVVIVFAGVKYFEGLLQAAGADSCRGSRVSTDVGCDRRAGVR
jgi:hypothetical protein